MFATVDYDKAVAYLYDGTGDIEIIDDKRQLAAKIEKQTQLSRSEIIKLTNFFCDKTTYGGSVASCFNPRFGMVLYKASKPMAFVSVCFECNVLASSIEIPDKEGGFSGNGGQKIRNFIKELKFP